MRAETEKMTSGKLYIYIGVGARDLNIDKTHMALDIFRFVVFFIWNVNFRVFCWEFFHCFKQFLVNFDEISCGIRYPYILSLFFSLLRVLTSKNGSKGFAFYYWSWSANTPWYSLQNYKISSNDEIPKMDQAWQSYVYKFTIKNFAKRNMSSRVRWFSKKILQSFWASMKHPLLSLDEHWCMHQTLNLPDYSAQIFIMCEIQWHQ